VEQLRKLSEVVTDPVRRETLAKDVEAAKRRRASLDGEEEASRIQAGIAEAYRALNDDAQRPALDAVVAHLATVSNSQAAAYRPPVEAKKPNLRKLLAKYLQKTGSAPPEKVSPAASTVAAPATVPADAPPNPPAETVFLPVMLGAALALVMVALLLRRRRA
jgi:MYXO-CTERM domain-containing protein